ncbi:branched-chain amino acid ABC transporter permease [Phreatobacter oligotrophus]|jgi:branched-chain amino acid transport system permease protein|uniref:Branched-chain amino acid transport system permease protein n=1 Tax=Phreatobacter oligotrophus TaxID=1122261 RepID=A0A2T4ZGE9_9HYPH|nr:branched-chain amino acid ABC transporter permease [Phreatobacter oligotrophus]PTM60999.1 branched-chain amino acid transport system permease protein [Phreatobacter oligotrophus]
MTAKDWIVPLAILAAAVVLAPLPLVAGSYWMALLVNVLMYAVLATAWALFSGPTHYVSLATAAFFGLGAYTMAFLGEKLPLALVYPVAALIGAVIATIVGLSTLRLSGVYFVIFTFGLAELVRQLVTWAEAKYGGTVGRFVFIDVTQQGIYWMLLGMLVLVLLTGFLVQRSRLGWALKAIGEDETVARHAGIDTTVSKVAVFVISATFMTVVGAIMAPRWTYIDPSIAFNPIISFQVLIMALLGGAARLYGPILGVVPLAILFEILQANFPNSFSILLGLAFLVIVYFVPSGIVGLIDQGRDVLGRAGRRRAHPAE